MGSNLDMDMNMESGEMGLWSDFTLGDTDFSYRSADCREEGTGS
jgi:hypothetical protein